MSERLYKLPFDTENHPVNIMQGWNGPWSHRFFKGFLDLSHAVDFELPLGSEVRAARDGIVLWVEQDSDWYYQGSNPEIGMNPPRYGRTNNIVIKHEDGSAALYSHLQKGGVVVARKQEVVTGQHIAVTGLSEWVGDTPHLHFHVAQERGYLVSSPFAFIDYQGSLEHADLYPQ